MTVIAADETGTFELAPEDEAALLAAITEAGGGALVDHAELVVKLARAHGPS